MINRRRSALRKLTPDAYYSFNVKIDKGENLLNELHYHPELELILLKKSTGKTVIGNSIVSFADNELLLIGRNLPHVFIHDDMYLDSSENSGAEALVIQFDETFLGEKFMNLPEVKAIQELFIVARQGIRVTDYVKSKIILLMEEIYRSSSIHRIILLLEILNLLVDKKSYDLVASDGFTSSVNKEKDARLNKVLNYTINNFCNNIKIEEVAAIINLTKESFCRFFKSHTGKTYVEYLIEFRVSQACRLLVESEMTIKEIGYFVGYENLSHFYCQFKRKVKMSPLEFRHKHLIPLSF